MTMTDAEMEKLDELSGDVADVLSNSYPHDSMTYRGSMIHQLYECADALRRHIEQMEVELAELAQRDATINAVREFCIKRSAEGCTCPYCGGLQAVLALLDKEQSCSTTGEVK